MLLTRFFPGMNNFYPRSPCGERRHLSMCHTPLRVFLSTLSLRRATQFLDFCDDEHTISIHALLAESDRQSSRTGQG